MNFNESMEYINSFSHSGKKVTDLSRIKGLLESLGNPHKKMKFVHIAGTNGKGSVLEYCSNALIKAGVKTGQFTSPFILTYCDRIRINGINIPEYKVAEICGRVKKAVKNDYYSQFEITFAIALLYFLEEKCEIVFLETGIGGTLDATNIIENPIASVITSISLDHTAILGNTVEEIAVHKLGIVKENSRFVLSCNNNENIKKISENVAADRNSRLVIPDINEMEIVKNSIWGTEFCYKGNLYTLKMCGEHQIINALTAIETIEILKNHFNISRENILKSLSESSVNSRIEIINRNPAVIIDGGHNEAGIDSLISVLNKSYVNSVIVVFGMVEGKPLDYAVDKISGISKRVYCVDGFINNSISSEKLKGMFEKKGVEAKSETIQQAVENALEYSAKTNTLLLICGSLYLASTVKSILSDII